MTRSATIAGAEWLADPQLQKLLAALSADGEEARVAGGAVRNALLGQPVADVDIATTTVPDETVRRVRKAGFKAIPTGAEHGTITAVGEGRPFEITTLRDDIETDGRHAKVSFGRDWKRDAERRDFTINALYAGADGAVVDLVGGVSDIESRTLRFIGDAETRIREDYLRILRFFRFFAWYGSGRPDAEGLKACARLKEGIEQLSPERVWSELKKLLTAPDPSRALLWMRQTGVLNLVLPESEKWGIDAMHGLVAAERDLGWPADPLLRLAAIIPPDAARAEKMARRLKMSSRETDRLVTWAQTAPLKSETPDLLLRKQLYYGDPTGISDRLRLSLSAARARALSDHRSLIEAGGYDRQLKIAETWEKPAFPIKGADLLAQGMPAGPELGEVLRKLEQQWVESGFVLDRTALLDKLGQT